MAASWQAALSLRCMQRINSSEIGELHVDPVGVSKQAGVLGLLAKERIQRSRQFNDFRVIAVALVDTVGALHATKGDTERIRPNVA